MDAPGRQNISFRPNWIIRGSARSPNHAMVKHCPAVSQSDLVMVSLMQHPCDGDGYSSILRSNRQRHFFLFYIRHLLRRGYRRQAAYQLLPNIQKPRFDLFKGQLFRRSGDKGL